MKRKEVLENAANCVLKDRQNEYGGMENNFGEIAKLWSWYLGKSIGSVDVANMMILLKMARAKSNPQHEDNYVDIAGYSACAAELVDGEPYGQ